MSAASLGFASVAVLLFAGAILLFAQSAARSRRIATSRFVDAQLERYSVSSAALGEDEGPTQRRDASFIRVPALSSLLLRAGVSSDRRFLTSAALLGAVIVLAALIFGGLLSAAAALLLFILLTWFRLWWKAERRAMAIVRQLPGFLDTMVRMVTIGASLPSAFQQVVPVLEMPLGGIMRRAAQLTQAGVELDVALRQVGRVYRVDELFLIAAVVGVSARFGGRIDLVLERMAAFMRDIQQAREELIALSAETRLSAWILALLPVGIALFIIIFNNEMFMGMWHDPLGKKMLFGAVGLQLFGSWLLYRLAKSV
ncbi:MAG: type II secretion system F family protein [Janthinobacterium lividum]